MNTKYERTIYTVSESLLSAFINGDESGLEQSDVDAITLFLMRFERCHALRPNDTEASFSRCQITGLMSNCVELTFDVIAIGGAQ